MLDHESLRTHAERIRASDVLGRSRVILQLFDYLVECSATGKTPKEIEVAVDVFGKSATFDVSQDAMVRVYIHKLRRKLEEYYEGPGSAETARIVIPKGSYRFTLEPVEVADQPMAAPELPPPQRHSARTWWIGGGLLAVALVSAFFLMDGRIVFGQPKDDRFVVQSNPVWSKLLSDQRPIVLVVGDYYIFGETDESMEVKRLVREFSINSHDDLSRYLQIHPEMEERYMDLQLAYLPTASAFALSEIMPVLAAAAPRVRVTMMSDLNPSMLKSAHVIYIGFLSGLGMLQETVFAGSRFAVGETYDELIDSTTQHRYVSQVGTPLRGDVKYHDYGYFSTFAGPSGNQIIIIAGTRDVAVMQVAEALSNRGRLEELTRRAGTASAFEALYEVYGMDRMNLDGKLLLTSGLDTARIWSEPGYPAIAASADQASAGR